MPSGDTAAATAPLWRHLAPVRLRWLVRLIWPHVPEPIEEATWRRLQRWVLGTSTVLAVLNVVARLLAPTDQGYDLRAMDRFLVSNLACHAGLVLVCAWLLARPFSEREARAGTTLAVPLALGTCLGALWLLGSVTNVQNTLFFVVIIGASRAWLDARLGLWALGCAVVMHTTLVGAEIAGLVRPHALVPHLDDPFYADPVSQALVLGWILVVYVLTWALAGLAALRYRESEHALRQLNASLEDLVRTKVAELERAGRLRRYLAPQLVEEVLGGGRPEIVRDRRPLTVFFCDLRGFTPLVETLDPDDLAEILNRYLDLVVSIAFAHGGTIDKFIGDAVMVFFGAPTATAPEEQATRCVRMALAVQAGLAPLRDEIVTRWGVEVGARVGIASGVASVGDFGSTHRTEFTAVGSPVNRAARLEPRAPVGGILVDEETRRLAAAAEGLRFVPHGELTLKGFAAPVPAFLAEHAT